MILYNVTINLDWSIHDEWLVWMKEVYIPGMMATGMFSGSQFVRLLHVDETEGPTYAIQYYTHSMDHYNLYMERYSALQGREEASKWGNKLVSFSTIME